MLTVVFDQFIRTGSISASNFFARPSAGIRHKNVAYFHGGGSVIGPMATTTDGGLGGSPQLDFRNVPADEIEGSSDLFATAELGFPLTVI